MCSYTRGGTERVKAKFMRSALVHGVTSDHSAVWEERRQVSMEVAFAVENGVGPRHTLPEPEPCAG